MAFELNGSNAIKVVFITEYAVNDDDACLVISGSIPELGSWNLAKSLWVREVPERSGKWISILITTPHQQFSWKWVVISKDRLRAIRWENINNREQTIDNESVILQAPWNEPALPQKSENIHRPVGSVASALQAIENSDEEDFTEKKANLGDYNNNLVQRLAKEIIEQETKISLALIDMIESGDEMDIKLQLSKLEARRH